MAPGIPTSCFSTTPGSPPPGLKSRQTTPVIFPSSGVGLTACFAFDGTSSGAMPVTASFATPPASIGFVSVNFADMPSPGWAPGSTPGLTKMS